MADPLPIGRIIRIRDCGYDEVWLQDQIVANPSSLRLGDLEVVTRERHQSSGGRLDILLKERDPYHSDDRVLESRETEMAATAALPRIGGREHHASVL